MQVMVGRNLSLPTPYRRWWLRFRRATNEAELIASTLATFLTQQATPLGDFNTWRMIDVGCGDAVLTTNLARLLSATGRRAPVAVDLIDPILQPEAVQTCREVLASTTVTPWPTDLERFLLSNSGDEGAALSLSLVIHSGYYISDSGLDEMCLNRSSLGSLVVVNSASSFMGDIWALVNEPMFEELERIGNWLQSRGQLLLRADASLRLPRSSDIPGRREVLSFLALQELDDLPGSTRKSMMDIVEKYRTSEEEVLFGLDFFYVPPRHQKPTKAGWGLTG